MDAFFVYLIFLQEIASKYWFVSIPIIGFNILGVVALYIGCARELSGLADKTYILTDKAIYFINHSSYKQTKRIAISDVARFEKDKSNSHIFYVCTQNDFIKVEYIENEMNFYSQLAKLINSR